MTTLASHPIKPPTNSQMMMFMEVFQESTVVKPAKQVVRERG
jgi:hypothetical protein